MNSTVPDGDGLLVTDTFSWNGDLFCQYNKRQSRKQGKIIN